MGKYRRLTKRRKATTNKRQRGGLGLSVPSFSSLVPSGFPTSVAALKTMVTETVQNVPALKTVSGAVGTISQVATSVTGVSETLTNLPQVIQNSVKGTIEATLLKSGLPPIGSSGASGASGSGPTEEAVEEAAEGAEAVEEAAEGEEEAVEEEAVEEEAAEGEAAEGEEEVAEGEEEAAEEEAAEGGGPNDSNNSNNSNSSNSSNSSNNSNPNSNSSNNSNSNSNSSNNSNSNKLNNSNKPINSNNSINIEQFGGNKFGRNKYELVTLSRPISDPLFVYYKSGKPVYFTKGSNGVRILTNGHVTMSVKKKKRLTRRAHKRS